MKILKNRKMQSRIASIFLTLVILTSGSSFTAFADVNEVKPQDITATAAILVDANTGNVLFEKNPQKVMYPASTTKIMTAMVALDAVGAGEVSLDDTFGMSEGAYSTMDIDGSIIGLKVGEAMNLKGLLQGLLIASGNDAAAVIAEGISGTIDGFVARMNEKAKELDLENTHFMNPHGLHHENHYTTAKDMMIITRKAMENPTFREIVECAHIYLPKTNMSDERYFINTNNLVSRMRYPYYFYDKATGIKTGSTSQAGSCLVASAQDGGKSVISVLFNSEDNSTSHNESKLLLEYGLTAFSLRTVAKRDDIFGEIKLKQAADGTDYLLLSAAKNFEVLFPKDGNPDNIEVVTEIPEKVYAPITSGQVIGKAKFIYDGREIGYVDLCSTMEVERHWLGFLMSFGEWIWGFKLVKAVVYIFLAVIILFVLLVCIGFYRALKKSKHKKRRMSTYNPPRY